MSGSERGGAKLSEPGGGGLEHLLGHVVGVLGPESVAAAPRLDEWVVEVNEPRPCVGRTCPRACEQARGERPFGGRCSWLGRGGDRLQQ